MLESFESVSPTAILTSYPRTFTDIPYEKDIYKWLTKNCKEDVKLNKMLAPEIEARYKLINKLIENSNIEQVLEIAAGYSSRGLIYSQNGYNYVEMDLKNVSLNKKKIVNSIMQMPSGLHIISGNALNKEDYEKCKKYFDEKKEIAIINEGLFRYLTFEEKKVVGQNIYDILKEYKGVWITCDVTPKKFIQKQDEYLPDFNTDLSKVISRNNLKDRFNNINHIKEFLGDIGFKNIEIHKFSEMKDKLSSLNILNIDEKEINELLEEAIVAVMKID